MTSTGYLLLNVSVCAATTLLLLIAIWAGLSKRHWFLRATVILASLAALYPIRAFEPMVWFAIAMPLTAWMSRYTWGRRPQVAGEQESGGKWNPIQFGLVDFMLVILIAGVVLAFAAGVRREQAAFNWEPGVVVLCSTVIGQLCLSIVLAKRWWRSLAGVSLVAFIALVGSAYSWALQTLPLGEYFVFNFIGPNEQFLFSASLFGSLAVLMLLTLLTARSLTALPSCESAWRRRFIRLSRVALALVMCAVFIPSLIVYVCMWEGRPIPANRYAGEPNNYVRVFEIIHELERLNPNQLTHRTYAGSMSVERAEKLKQLNAELISQLQTTGRVPFVFGKDATFDYMEIPFEEFQSARCQTRIFDAEAEDLGQAGRFVEASSFCLASMRLGNTVSRGGLLVHWLVSYGVGSTGRHGMVRVREKVTMPQARSLLTAFQTIEQSREPLAMIAERDEAYDDKAYNWVARLSAAVVWLQGKEYESLRPTPCESFEKLRDAELRLLIADFGIRLYQSEHGGLPDDLKQLVPDLIESVPIDPYSGNPLIYRRHDDGWSIYSTGPDGQDDGGRFGTYDEVDDVPGYDLDLEVSTR